MVRRIATIVLITALAATAAACSGDSSGDGESPEATPDQVLDVAMTDIAFSTTDIAAGPNERLRLNFRNDGALTHDFTIVEIPADTEVVEGGSSGDEHDHAEGENDVHVAVEPGDEATLDLEPAAAGTYEFYCSVEGHREAGMTGVLRVE